MQRFWYHSPVRFYKTQEELEDMTNPQNTQFFGHVGNPYPLEVNEFHRFLIPNFQNEVESQDIQLWLIGDSEIQIPCEFGISEGKLVRITFISFEEIQGSFQIRSGNEVLFYSNCVRFLDSSDDEGRKYIRIATKHTYDRGLFTFGDGNHDWIITNLPARCMGIFDIDEEVEMSQAGMLGSSLISSARLEENVKYEFDIKGDNNILTFITVHSTNNDFYIDGTRRTRKEKPEYEEFSAKMTMKFSNQKNENGFNIIFNENEVFEDVMKTVLGNDKKSIIYSFDLLNAIGIKRTINADESLLLNIPFENSIENKVAGGISMEAAGGAPSFGIGRKGNDFAAIFDGLQSIRTQNSLNIDSDKVTVSFWMKPNTNEYSVPFELSDYAVPNNAFVLLLNNNGDNIHWVDSASGNLNSKLYTITINSWIHIVLTIDRSLGSSQNNIYVNSTSQGENVYSGDLSGVFGIYQFFIGQRAGNTLGFKGRIQDFKLWNRVLSQDEIIDLHNS